MDENVFWVIFQGHDQSSLCDATTRTWVPSGHWPTGWDRVPGRKLARWRYRIYLYLQTRSSGEEHSSRGNNSEVWLWISAMLGPIHTKWKQQLKQKWVKNKQRIQRINDKHQRHFSLSLPFSFGVNEPLRYEGYLFNKYSRWVTA